MEKSSAASDSRKPGTFNFLVNVTAFCGCPGAPSLPLVPLVPLAPFLPLVPLFPATPSRFQESLDSFFLHFWNSVFGRIGIDRNTRPPVGSFLDEIYGPHTSRFNLRELDVNSYKRTIELMKAFVNEESIMAERKLGYDVTRYPFDDLIGCVVAPERPTRSGTSPS